MNLQVKEVHMLTHLHVKNFAVVKDVEVDFGDNLNILTGETGAGKSVIIGSVNIALGGRISSDMIRSGEDYAYVEMVFEPSDNIIKNGIRDMFSRYRGKLDRRNLELKSWRRH